MYCYTIVSFICYFIVGVSGDYCTLSISHRLAIFYYTFSADIARAIYRAPRGFMACAGACDRTPNTESTQHKKKRSIVGEGEISDNPPQIGHQH